MPTWGSLRRSSRSATRRGRKKGKTRVNDAFELDLELTSARQPEKINPTHLPNRNRTLHALLPHPSMMKTSRLLLLQLLVLQRRLRFPETVQVGVRSRSTGRTELTRLEGGGSVLGVEDTEDLRKERSESDPRTEREGQRVKQREKRVAKRLT